MKSKILIIDYGSQYTHLIAKRLRNAGYYAVIDDNDFIEDKEIKGIILSGGPGHIDPSSDFNKKILDLDVPVLGICFGHQLIINYFGGSVAKNTTKEFGKTKLIFKNCSLFSKVPAISTVWMSHFDSIEKIPDNFEVIACSTNNTSTNYDYTVPAALKHKNKDIYTLQFHPEVKDTDKGLQILINFADLCKLDRTWNTKHLIKDIEKNIIDKTKDKNVLMFLSGGVDSTVAFVILCKVLGKSRVKGLFIDNGFLRQNEADQVIANYKILGYDNIEFRDYSSYFLQSVKDIYNSESKRKFIGKTFLDVRTKFLQELNLDTNTWMLGQGTLYPDIIESGGSKKSNVIKSHHNRIDLVTEYIKKGLVVEPLANLYKDEVRKLGIDLGLPKELVMRHPFPGPGLAINVISSTINHAETIDNFLPVKSVGVQGDERTFKKPFVIDKNPDWETVETQSINITNTKDTNRVVMYMPPNKQKACKNVNWKSSIASCNKQRLDLLRKAEYIVTTELKKSKILQDLFQVLVILLPISEQGTKESIVIRPVISEDVMTAQFAKIDWNILDNIVKKLYTIKKIDSVFYDVTHKPPATFGWE